MAEENGGPNSGQELASQFMQKRLSELMDAPRQTLCCPITHALLTNAVLAADGQVYEKSAIERHLSLSCGVNGDRRTWRSPMSNVNVSSKNLQDCWFAKSAVEDFRKAWEKEALEFVPWLIQQGSLDKLEALTRKAEEFLPHDMVKLQFRLPLVKAAFFSKGGLKKEHLIQIYQTSFNEAVDVIKALTLPTLQAIAEEMSNDCPVKMVIASQLVTLQQERLMARMQDDHAQQGQLVNSRVMSGATDQLLAIATGMSTLLAEEEEEQEDSRLEEDMDFDLFG